MRFLGVDALESYIHCSNNGSFDFIAKDIVLLFLYALVHDPHSLDEFHLEYSSR